MKIEGLDEHNKKIIESLMEKNLKAMCDIAKIRYPEFDVGEEMYYALTGSENFNDLRDLSQQYDDLYRMAEAFNIRNAIDFKFRWMKNLFD